MVISTNVITGTETGQRTQDATHYLVIQESALNVQDNWFKLLEYYRVSDPVLDYHDSSMPAT